MGFIPQPPPDSMTMRVGETVVDMTQYLPHYAWLCLYCRSNQPASRDSCCNCGAPKPGVEEAAAWIADQFAARLGLKPWK